MIDLKTANADLAAAIAALESQEHVADLREWAQARARVNELDERISARMKAKIHAHSAIVEAWGMPEMVAEPELSAVDEPSVVSEDLLAACDAEPVLTAAAWDTHHAASVGIYALSGDEVPDPVLESGVVEAERVGA